MPTAPAGQAGSQAVDRAAALLALVVESGEPRTFTSLVEEAGLAKSTTSRLLHALERGRLVQRDRSGSFRPGPVFAVYAARQQTMHDLVALLRPAHGPARRDDRRDGELRGPARRRRRPGRPGRQPLPARDDELGRRGRRPAALLGAGQGLLRVRPAAAPAAVRPAAPHPEHRGDQSPQLERDLVDVRRRGWAVANEELEIGLVAVAAPVRATDGIILGALSVSGPTARIPAGRIVAVGEALVAEARKVSALLGYHHSGKEGAA